MRLLLIRTKIAAVFSILIFLISLFIYFYFPWKLEEQAFESIINKAKSISEITAFSISPALLFKDFDDTDKSLEGLRNDKDLVYIVVSDENGKIFYSFNIDKATQMDFHSNSTGQAPYDIIVYKTSTNVIYNDKLIGKLYLGISLNELKQNVEKSKKTISLVSLIIFIIGISIVLIISEIITKPLHQMVRTVKQIEKGDLKKRAVIKSNDEIGDLGMSFNYMVDALEVTYKRLRNFNQLLEEQVKERTNQLEMEMEEHRKAETALRESEEKSRTFMETASDLIHMTDKNGYFTYVNEATTNTLGYTKEEMIGMHITQVLRNETFETFKPKLDELISKRQIKLESVWITKDGRKIYGDIKVVAVFDSNGEFTGSSAIFRDITERKQLEEERVKANKLESIGILAGGIAHDFNNILAVIMGNTSLAKMSLDNTNEAEILLSEVEKASLRAKDLTQQLLTFSKGGAPVK